MQREVSDRLLLFQFMDKTPLHEWGVYLLNEFEMM